MPRASALQREIRQTRPFRSDAQEASIAIARTADQIQRAFGRLLEPHGISGQQYNVLRILRGAHPEPLPTLEIGERMIQQTPGVTRLLDRLESAGLVTRERCTEDRRLVHCRISPAGLDLLARLDQPVDQQEEALMRRLTRAERRQLIILLERVRQGT